MSKLILICLAAFALIVAPATEAKVINLKDQPFAAAGDGKADDREALVKAFAALEAGDTLLIPPGDYRISLLQGPLHVPAGTTILGQNGKSRLLLFSNDGPKKHREFLRPRSDVTLEGITIERDGDFPAVLIPMFGDVSKIQLRHCTIIGNVAKYPGDYCHAIQVGVGTLKDVLLHGVHIADCTFGLFQQNAATGTVDGFVVEHSSFERNTASDLEFNSPKGVMRNIVVRNCFFRENRCKTAGAGFAVGFANVQDSRVENCHITGYSSEALHVEDRSANIQLTGNTIVGGSLKHNNGVIMVLSGSDKVTIERNYVDARPNENRPHLVLVTAGGKFSNPANVAVKANVLVNGASTRTWYLQPGSGPAPEGNVVVPSARDASKE